eukprot:TRINITY_DN651_c0_g3_i1.p1 TRINITY_DN651_c0_g3~~TRINITY_DN651_c0_g3_i1.p1  ORF type:complete len:123 (-),score=18.36 TRINITY_DN651_c0_g3_i1:242-610(-)
MNVDPNPQMLSLNYLSVSALIRAAKAFNLQVPEDPDRQTLVDLLRATRFPVTVIRFASRESAQPNEKQPEESEESESSEEEQDEGEDKKAEERPAAEEAQAAEESSSDDEDELIRMREQNSA